MNKFKPSKEGEASRFWVKGFSSPVIGAVENISVLDYNDPRIFISIREVNGNLAVVDLENLALTDGRLWEAA